MSKGEMSIQIALGHLTAAGVPASALAARLGVTPDSLSLKPPRDWQHELALLALERAAQHEGNPARLRALAGAVREGVPGSSYSVEDIPATAAAPNCPQRW